jgi:aryl-alcohol dehydrogenase-like predicted oxidoreductase
LTALSLAWTLQRPAVASLVLGPRSRAQLATQLTALEVELSVDALGRIDGIVPPGNGTVPYYLDDSFADFRPQPYHW